MFRNKKWEMPEGLVLHDEVKAELTLWDAVTLFLKHPEVKESSVRERHEHCLDPLGRAMGQGFPRERRSGFLK